MRPVPNLGVASQQVVCLGDPGAKLTFLMLPFQNTRSINSLGLRHWQPVRERERERRKGKSLEPCSPLTWHFAVSVEWLFGAVPLLPFVPRCDSPWSFEPGRSIRSRFFLDQSSGSCPVPRSYFRDRLDILSSWGTSRQLRRWLPRRCAHQRPALSKYSTESSLGTFVEPWCQALIAEAERSLWRARLLQWCRLAQHAELHEGSLARLWISLASAKTLIVRMQIPCSRTSLIGFVRAGVSVNCGSRTNWTRCCHSHSAAWSEGLAYHWSGENLDDGFLCVPPQTSCPLFLLALDIQCIRKHFIRIRSKSKGLIFLKAWYFFATNFWLCNIVTQLLQSGNVLWQLIITQMPLAMGKLDDALSLAFWSRVLWVALELQSVIKFYIISCLLGCWP